MPKSHKRGGQKAHNKRVKARNERIASERKKFIENYQKLMDEKMDQYKNMMSASTENIEPEIIVPEVVDFHR